MLSSGIIEPANSPYGLPIVLIKKSDKSWPFCIDYRKLNSKAVFDVHSMPRVDELIESVGRANSIYTLDLSKVYWQIKLNEDAKQRLAFVTPFGSYRLRVMPFWYDMCWRDIHETHENGSTESRGIC